MSGTPSTDSLELSTTQALTASLTTSLADAERNRYIPRNKRPSSWPGRGGDRAGPAGRSRKGDRGERGVLGEVNNEVDQRLTWHEDLNCIEKKFKNKNYYHTHGYECATGHDSAHCMYPEKGHKHYATVENPMGGCLLYKQLWQSYCTECTDWRCGTRERSSETSIIRKILKVAHNKKSEIKNKPLKSILLSSSHQNKRKQ